jgi:ATP-dependent RNA helicase DeaD
MMTFEQSGVSAEILKAITEIGYEKPTPIQEKTIIHLLTNSEQDLLALAQTGTGKTAAFGLPIIQQVDPKNGNTQAIILSPTRELCVQIAQDIKSYSKYIKGLKVLAVYGGAPIDSQLKALSRGVQIVVGTPGRTLDLIKRKKLKLNDINWLVLDEADEMLNMGFKDELDGILETTPETKQTLLFAATMPAEISHIAKKYMKSPVEMTVGKKNAGADKVEHIYYVVNPKDKYAALKRLADIHPNIYGIAFCRTRQETKEVAENLINDGYNADALHGDLSQAMRDLVMHRFRIKGVQILVATDVAARGLDVNDLTHVINYNLPDDPEVYVHRSGRTGRAGKSGLSFSIITPKESSKIKALEKMVNKSFEKGLIPSGAEVVEARLFNLVDKIKDSTVDKDQILPYLDDIYSKLENLSKEELIQKFVTNEFNRILRYYKSSTDINVEAAPDKPKRSGRNISFSRFYINVGTRTNFNASHLIGLVNDVTKQRNIEIGRIDIMKGFSFFEADKSCEGLIIKSFQNIEYKGIKLKVELTNSKPVDDNKYGQRRKRGKRKPQQSHSSKHKSGGGRRKKY